MRRPTLCAAVASTALVAALAAPAAGQVIRVVTYNVASLEGDAAELEAVFAALNDDDVPGFATAPHVYVFQEVGSSSEFETLEDLLNDVAPPGVTYNGATFTNSNELPGAQGLVYRADVLFEVTAEHEDIFTGATRNADRWRLQMLADSQAPEKGFYVYGMHLKASQGEENEALREDGVLAVRADADTLPEDAQIVYAGDMNFYHNDEPGYHAFLAAGPGRAQDPLGSGPWGGTGHAEKHTQSPRASGNGGLVGGGLDDRFDMILVSSDLNDDIGIRLIPGTCRALGNDGQHYNTSINQGDNFYYSGDIPRSNALADALHEASDHVPVLLELELPEPPPPDDCDGDVSNDDSVDVEDLIFVILSWGPCDCNADLDDSGVVDVVDLVEVILNWGPCE